ncbi:MAG TPA: TolC family protein [Bryobacteraceae bacterium]|nr:TolC family protein [Bryobacteraceae bacterium]
MMRLFPVTAALTAATFMHAQAPGDVRPFSRPSESAPVRASNSGRLDELLRDGKLQLSLQDAIALALENNLDLELQRYGTRIADTDLERARAGGFLRGIPLSVREGPPGLGSPVVGPNGSLGGGDTPALNAITGPGVQTDLSIIGSLPLSTGPAVPRYDPWLAGTLSWNQLSTPQNSLFLPNLTNLTSRTTTANVGVEQGFISGGSASLRMENDRTRVNNPLLLYNPYVSSGLVLSLRQPLLRGFGPGVNTRYIHIAQNNQRISKLVFQQQVISTVTAVVRLYWDLVSLNNDVRVRQESVVSAEQLLQDVNNQVSEGTAAKIDATRANAELSRRSRDLAVARTLVRQQEAVLKDFLTRTTNAQAMTADIVPTDSIAIPEVEKIQPMQDLVQRAFESRPDLAQARVQIENSEISLKGSRNALLPTVDVIASARNNALIGDTNPVAGTGLPLTPTGGGLGAPIFLGGYGGALSQLFSRNFPDYGVGVEVNIPIRNRSARADVVRDQLSVRQQQIRFRQLEKQVRLEITNAVLAVEQARASFEAARSERMLQEESLTAERDKLQVGASTNYVVTQFQRDLTAARSAEVSAQSSYQKAKTALQRAIGTTLDDYGVVLQEALDGSVARRSMLPGGK